MGRPTTSLSLRPGPSQWGDPVGLLPPQKRQTVRDSFPSYGSNHSQMPARGILSLFVGLRANEHWPQQQGTMTNRVRHLAKSARKRNVVLVEAFFPLLVLGARDVRGVRTTTGLVVLGRIPLLNIRDRGAYHIKRVVKREPGYLFHSTFRPIRPTF